MQNTKRQISDCPPYGVTCDQLAPDQHRTKHDLRHGRRIEEGQKEKEDKKGEIKNWQLGLLFPSIRLSSIVFFPVVHQRICRRLGNRLCLCPYLSFVFVFLCCCICT